MVGAAETEEEGGQGALRPLHALQRLLLVGREEHRTHRARLLEELGRLAIMRALLDAPAELGHHR